MLKLDQKKLFSSIRSKVRVPVTLRSCSSSRNFLENRRRKKCRRKKNKGIKMRCRLNYIRLGYTCIWKDMLGYEWIRYDRLGCERIPYDRLGYERIRYDRLGYERVRYDRLGYDRIVQDMIGYDRTIRIRQECRVGKFQKGQTQDLKFLVDDKMNHNE